MLVAGDEHTSAAEEGGKAASAEARDTRLEEQAHRSRLAATPVEVPASVAGAAATEDSGEPVVAPTPEDAATWAPKADWTPKRVTYELSYRSIASPKLWIELVGATAVLFIFGALYLAPVWLPQERLHNLIVSVGSCDAGAGGANLGAQVVAQLLPPSPASSVLGWRAVPCSCANGSSPTACRDGLVRSVMRGDVWAALYVGPSFTSDVLSNAPALGAPGPPAQPAVEHLFAQGRSYTTLSFLRVATNQTFAALSNGFGRSLLAAAAAGGPTYAPSYFLTPILLVETNLAPVLVFGEHFASYLLCLLLWMGSAFTVALSFQYKTAWECARAGFGG